MQVKNLLTAVPRVLFTNAPLDAQLIVTRRCNLSCGYCSEYDSFSDPVPTADLKERIDALHRLHSTNITMLGGEPLGDRLQTVEHIGGGVGEWWSCTHLVSLLVGAVPCLRSRLHTGFL